MGVSIGSSCVCWYRAAILTVANIKCWWQDIIIKCLVIANTLLLSVSVSAFDFELPDVNDQWYQLASVSDKVVYLFVWQSDCSSCQEELDTISEFAHSRPDAHLILITTDAWQDSLPRLARLPDSVTLLRALNGELLLRRMGNKSAALPFTLVLTKTHDVCQKKLGIVSLAWLRNSLITCQ